MKIRHIAAITIFCAAVLGFDDVAQGQTNSSNLGRIPVIEVTVFKDGHAFIVHEGKVKRNASGEIMLNEVPTPVLGTFWVYSADANSKVTSVTAGQRIVPIERTALSLAELIEANPNVAAAITETNQTNYGATILGFLKRSSMELAETSPPNTQDQLPQKGNVVLLKTDHGTKALTMDQIQSITFKDGLKLKGPQEEFRNYLRLNVSSTEELPRLGLTYLQKGIRWIPSYRIDLDGKGQASVKLEAIVINEMMDLTNVTLNLVIGVPSFAFKDTIDPIAVQGAASQLSQYFQSTGRGQVLAYNFGNAIVSQTAANAPAGAPESAGPPTDLPAGAKNEDLYVFTLHNVTLKKGERMALPISQQTNSYQDIYTLDIPFAPPAELGRNYGGQQQAELARLMAAPKVMHKARIKNSGQQPLTTAPALILRDGKLIAQSLMTYAALGASADVALTTAVDIQVQKSDTETNRTPDALIHEGDHYFRVDLKGHIQLTNRRGTAADIEVKRYVLGQVDRAEHDGKIEMVNFFESREYLPSTGEEVPWWNFYNWPWWWNRVNGASRITWNIKLDPGQSADLDYAWHYFWR